MGRKVSNGNSVRVTVPQNTTILQGNFYLLDGFFGMAIQSVTTGAGQTTEVVLDIEPVEYESSQITTADAFAKGSNVFWNDTTKLLTVAGNDDSTGDPQNRLVGKVTAAKDANNVIWFILGPPMQVHP